MANVAIWNCRFQLLHSLVADLSAAEESLHLGQSFLMLQPGIGDFGANEAKRLQLGESLQVHQPSVGELRRTKYLGVSH